jgi:hypothetical protein
VTLDAGGLIAYERRRREVDVLLARAIETGLHVAIPAGVLAQVWRDGIRQARVARLVDADGIEVVPLDHRTALGIGRICATTGATDVVDASVVLCARLRRHVVLTSDPEDLLRIDPKLEVVAV